MKNEIQGLLSFGHADSINKIELLDWRLEKSDHQTAIVYQLAESDDAEVKLQKRLKQNSPGLLILNRKPSFEVKQPLWVVNGQSWMKLQKLLCDNFFSDSKNKKYIGITGTNGKTTTTDLVLQLLEMANKNALSIGTLGARQKGATLEEIGLTTPGYVQLREIIHRLGRESEYIVMEASSHALIQERLFQIKFSAAAWTSFTQDHLDYHKNMDEYFEAKKLILKHMEPSAKLFVPFRQTEILNKLTNNPNVEASNELSEEIKSTLPPFFKSTFNLENLSCALSILKSLGLKIEQSELKKLQSPPGRFYIKEWNSKVAIVDFAHTPDALENILKAVKTSFPNHKVKVLFGCGGDRDRTKRPLMGKIAEQFADEVILSSDNPRTEDPAQIIDDIAAGMKPERIALKMVDRKQAVKKCLTELKAHEVLVLAGKGHEDYIILGTTKTHYSDIEEVDKFVTSTKAEK